VNHVFFREKYCIFSAYFSTTGLEHATEEAESHATHDGYKEIDQKYLLANQDEDRHHRSYPGGWAYHEICQGRPEASIAAKMGTTA